MTQQQQPRRVSATASVDFDKVLHTYDNGWADGTVYGELVPGAEDALRALLEHHAVVVHTTRDVHQVGRWLAERTAFAYATDTGSGGNFPFWNIADTILISNRKWAARFYIDDRAVHFAGDWGRALAAAAELTDAPIQIPQAAPPHWPVSMATVAQWPTYPPELAVLARQRARLAAYEEWDRRWREGVIAPPSEHCAALVDAALAVIGIDDGTPPPRQSPQQSAQQCAQVPAPAGPSSPSPAAAESAPGDEGGPGPAAPEE